IFEPPNEFNKKKITLTDTQKYELCLYANNNKKTRSEYVEWVEQKWGVRIDKITFPELELALKEFVLSYQHRVILSDSILIKKAKLLAIGLSISENTLLFSS
ncbi:4020_t:CDS:2, partial [Diversispora eburnea]